MAIRPGGKGFEIVSELGNVLGSYETEEEARAHEGQLLGRSDLLVRARGDQLQRRRVSRADDRQVQHFDRIGLRFDKSTVTRVEENPGMIEVWGVATRVGVFVYDDDENPGGIIRERRPASEVLDAASLKTLEGAPFTIDHPNDEVTSSNASDLTHGWIRAVKVDGKLVRTHIRIATDEALEAIKAGTVELSCGYTARLEAGAGVHESGERFDATQREIRYNHLALVDLARAGPVARLHIDGASRGIRTQRQRDKARPMKTKITIDGKTYDLPDMLLAGIESKADSVRNNDQVETGEISITTSEGPVDLVLPMASIEEILNMLGAAPSAAPAPEPEPELPADTLEEETDQFGEEEEELDAKESGKPNPFKGDAKALEALVAKQVSKAVRTALADADTRRRDRADLERRASDVLADSYDYRSHDDAEIARDAITAVDDSDKADAAALCARAKKGDQVALGELFGMMRSALKANADETRSDKTGDTMRKVFQVKDGGSAPQNTDVPSWEQARADRIAKLSGQAPKDDKATA